MSFVGFGNVLLNGLGVDLKFLFKKRKKKYLFESNYFSFFFLTIMLLTTKGITEISILL